MMHNSIERKVTLSFGTAVFMLSMLAIFSYKSVRHFIAAAGWDNHTRLVIATIAETNYQIVTVESAARGYLITGEERHVQRYREAVAAVGPSVDQLAVLVSDNPRERERLARLGPLVKSKLDIMERAVSLRHTAGLEDVRRIMPRGEGVRIMNELQGILADMRNEEEELLGQRTAAEQASAARSMVLICGGSGFALGVVVVAGWKIRRDIAARRQVETALRESEEQYRFLTNSMPEIMWSATPDGRLEYYNARWHEFTGKSLEQTRGDGWRPVLHPEDLQKCADRWTESVRTGNPFEGEYRFRRADGVYRWQLCRGLPRRDARGHIVQWLGNCTDIDDHKRAEAALAQFEAIVDSSDDAIISKTLDGIVRSWNPGAEKMFGFTAEQIIGQPIAMLAPPELLGEQPHVLERLAHGESLHHFDTIRVCKDGRRINVSATICPIHDRAANIVAASEIARDTTDSTRVQRELDNQNVRLAAANKELESFSYSVSHDLRAPLRSIDGFSQALLEDYADKLDDEGRDSLQRIRAATQRMGHLIDDMLNLSRVTRSELRPEAVDLSAMAGAVAAELAKQTPERQVEVLVADGLIATGDARLLRVVLDNLLGNAWKFTGRQERARVEFGVLDAGVFFVRDNGAGFDMAYAQKLFGAFQRLHAMNEFAGTGVGLATVQRIIHRHGGRVWADGNVGKGATFYFTLSPETPLQRAA